MSHFSNDNPASLFPNEPDDDSRRQFEEQTIATFYASGNDLLSLGYDLYDIAILMISLYEKPVEPPRPSIDPFA